MVWFTRVVVFEGPKRAVTAREHIQIEKIPRSNKTPAELFIHSNNFSATPLYLCLCSLQYDCRR